MKHMFLAFVIVPLVAVVALYAAPGRQASQQKPSTAAPTSKPAPATQARPAVQTQVVTADFVSYDAKTRKITVKDDKGQTSTAPLDRTAVSEVQKLHAKSGDHLMVTFRNNAKGEHQAVTAIKLATPRG